VRQVYANGNQTGPARPVAHTKELSQRVRKDAQTVPERMSVVLYRRSRQRLLYTISAVSGENYII